MQYSIHFLKENKIINVQEGTTLLEAEIAAGVHPDAPCGGQGTCGKCLVRVLDGANPGIQKACTVHISEDLTVDTVTKEGTHTILENGVKRQTEVRPYLSSNLENHWLVAFDIGTTTLVAYLLDGRTGEQIQLASMMNPQSQYGADVIMRCNYVLEHGGSPLSFCIREAMNQLIQEVARMQKISVEEISQISFVGNTCMHHLFLELNPDSLVKAPYVPVIVEPLIYKASDYQLKIHPDGILKILPNIGGFVGADTVGCLISTDFEHRQKITLMIDIGTNGEMALTDGKRILACSTAAGPAFEGAKISCGMRGADGAIDHIAVKDGKIQWHVIGDCEPVGICGSGLLDCIAMLLRLGFIDESGRMMDSDELEHPIAQKYSSCITEIDNRPAFQIWKNVCITQKDVREVQLAKGAIAAGITIMCKHLQISVDDIQEVMIAGAFGNYMEPASACAIGLIPPVLHNRITAIGNAAGEGSKIALLNHSEFVHSGELIQNIEFLELASEPDFQDIFVDELEYPQQLG